MLCHLSVSFAICRSCLNIKYVKFPVTHVFISVPKKCLVQHERGILFLVFFFSFTVWFSKLLEPSLAFEILVNLYSRG